MITSGLRQQALRRRRRRGGKSESRPQGRRRVGEAGEARRTTRTLRESWRGARPRKEWSSSPRKYWTPRGVLLTSSFHSITARRGMGSKPGTASWRRRCTRTRPSPRLRRRPSKVREKTGTAVARDVLNTVKPPSLRTDVDECESLAFPQLDSCLFDFQKCMFFFSFLLFCSPFCQCHVLLPLAPLLSQGA